MNGSNVSKEDETLERLTRELVQPVALEDLKVSFIAPTHRHLDFFLCRVYQYHLSRGYAPLIASRVVSLLTIGFTLLFSTFLMAFVNWDHLIECAYRKESCSELSVWRSVADMKNSSSTAFLLIYFVVFGLYWTWNAVTLGYEIQDYSQVRTFYREKLCIPDHRLREWEWGDILRLCISNLEPHPAKTGVSVLDYTSRMLRVENYITALLNAQCKGSEEAGQAPILDMILRGAGDRSFDLFGLTVEWSIWWCIFLSGGIFTPTARLHQEDIKAERLRSRLRYTIVFFCVLMPFLLLFMTMVFVLKHADRFAPEGVNHSKNANRPSEGQCSRDYTLRTKWMLREYNELQETHERRLRNASRDAEAYLSHFVDPLTETISRFVSFVSGSIVGVLLILTLIDSNILLYIQLGEKTLVWHLALWSAILAVSRLFISHKREEPMETVHQDFRKVVKAMKWCKTEWQHRAHTEEVYQEISSMFPPSVMLFGQELVATLLTPWTLYSRFYPKAEQISEFILQSTVCIPSIGDVCYHSTLQMLEGQSEEEQVILDLHRPRDPERGSLSLYRSKFVEPIRKLQQSTLSFMKQYPDESIVKHLEMSFMPTISPRSPMLGSHENEALDADSLYLDRSASSSGGYLDRSSMRPKKELRFSTFESILEESFNYEE
jgi:autophagy-related protein 9